MRAQLRFKTALTLSFTAILMSLYGAASLMILGFQSRQSRTDLHYLLYSEAEAAASYIASTQKLDFPELVTFVEHTPVPVWLRVTEHGEVVAATPELPDLTVEPDSVERVGDLGVVLTNGGRRLASVRHDVWNRPGMEVEALTRPDVLGKRSRQLLLNLVLTGLILVPLSVLAGRFLSRYALRPVDSLVTSIRGMDPQSLDHRLAADGPVKETSDLAREFNNLLERVASTVEHLQRFTATASHELRTPISSLRTGIEVALRRQRSAAEYRTICEESLEEIVRMQHVVEGLMGLARERTEADEAPPRRAVCLAGVIRLAERTLGALATAKDLRISEQLDEGVEVWGHEAQLQLMVINLLDNAIKYSPRGGDIRITSGHAEDMARMTVADQGPGIPASDRPFVFDRHFQGGRRPRRDGTPRIGGIGLDVVRWVAEVHRGRVRLVDGCGAGAKLGVLIPLADPEDRFDRPERTE